MTCCTVISWVAGAAPVHLPTIEIHGEEVLFNLFSPKGEEGSKTDLVFRGKMTGNVIIGTASGPRWRTMDLDGQTRASLAASRSGKMG